MDRPRNAFLDRGLYVIARCVACIIQGLPPELALQVGKVAGALTYYLDAAHRRRALENLAHAYPQLSPARRRTMARASLQHLGMLGIEVLLTTRMIHLRSWARHVRLVNIQAVLGLLVKPSRKRRGLIMLTGHYGNWEILGYVLATLGFETWSVARPLDNPYINRWLLGVRERRGQKMIDKKGATTEVTGILENGGAVAFIADQNAGKKGTFVDFFNRKASTYKSIALLAMQYEVPVVVGYARRLNDRFTFEAGVRDIIYPADWRHADDPVFYITQRYTAALESVVREAPDQYFWFHRRWKTRPRGEGVAQTA